MNTSCSRKPLAVMVLAGLALGILSFERQAHADWTYSPLTKWVQMPDLTQTGLDVYVTAPKVLADDFLCTQSGPIVGIHFWGSWLQDQVGIITNIHLSFHSDIPAGMFGTNYSRPGPLLWSYDTGTDFTPVLYADLHPQFELFYDPNQDAIRGPDSLVFLYNIRVPEFIAFTQQAGNIYWLDVQAQLQDTNNFFFGWKTAITNWNDDAVFDDSVNDPHNWRDMHYPPGHYRQGQSINLSFALETIPEPASWTLMMAGAGVVGLWHRRRTRRH
jgi:hypothetical protein